MDNYNFCKIYCDDQTGVNINTINMFLLYYKKLKDDEILVVNLNANNDISYKLNFFALNNLIKSNKISSRVLIKQNITNYKLKGNNNIKFSPLFKCTQTTGIDYENLKKFISMYETIFGVLPFFTTSNQLLDKVEYFNDIILGFSSKFTVD